MLLWTRPHTGAKTNVIPLHTPPGAILRSDETKPIEAFIHPAVPLQVGIRLIATSCTGAWSRFRAPILPFRPSGLPAPSHLENRIWQSREQIGLTRSCGLAGRFPYDLHVGASQGHGERPCRSYLGSPIRQPAARYDRPVLH